MTNNIAKTASILREIVTIIMALAFTNAILVFLSAEDGSTKPPSEFSFNSVITFIGLVTLIIRFFHGNHAYLQRTYALKDYVASLGKFNRRLTIDFVFIFLQAVMFCSLSNYQNSPSEFYSLLTFLFILDAVWFSITLMYIQKLKASPKYIENESDSQTIMGWVVANFLTALIMGGILVWTNDEAGNVNVPLLCFVLLLNTIADYYLNWRTYFPSGLDRHSEKHVFVAGRFTSAISENGDFDEKLKRILSATHETVTNCGFHLLSAHRTEDFGEKLEDADKFVVRDLKEIVESRVMVAVLEDNSLSSGVAIEMGWAAAFDIPIVAVVPDDYSFDDIPMVGSLGELTSMRIMRYSDITTLQSRLTEYLEDYR